MTEFREEYFTATTADDQRKNCFFGAKQDQPACLGEGSALPAGTYRVIDGTLYRVISGLPIEDVRTRLMHASEPDSPS